jgi:outer membrane protein insertion porin family
MNFGYPISETQRLGFSLGVTDTKITSGQYAVQEIAASPRLAPEIEYWYYSTQQADGSYAAAEVLEPIDTLPLSALSPPENEGFLDLNGDKYLNWSLTGSWLQSNAEPRAVGDPRCVAVGIAGNRSAIV